jgi:hypothetical protein
MTDAQCAEIVYIRDRLRVDRRRGRHFSMHYIKRKCYRNPKPNGYCWQHQPQASAIPDPARGDGSKN